MFFCALFAEQKVPGKGVVVLFQTGEQGQQEIIGGVVVSYAEKAKHNP